MARHLRFHKAQLNGHPGNVSAAVKSVIPRGLNAGLVVTATTDGVHAAGSFHNPSGLLHRGRAVDLGVKASLVGTAEARRRLVQFQSFLFHHFPGAFNELIGPDNDLVILRGVHHPLREGDPLENQHDNHVHVAPKRRLPRIHR